MVLPSGSQQGRPGRVSSWLRRHSTERWSWKAMRPSRDQGRAPPTPGSRWRSGRWPYRGARCRACRPVRGVGKGPPFPGRPGSQAHSRPARSPPAVPPSGRSRPVRNTTRRRATAQGCQSRSRSRARCFEILNTRPLRVARPGDRERPARKWDVRHPLWAFGGESHCRPLGHRRDRRKGARAARNGKTSSPSNRAAVLAAQLCADPQSCTRCTTMSRPSGVKAGLRQFHRPLMDQPEAWTDGRRPWSGQSRQRSPPWSGRRRTANSRTIPADQEDVLVGFQPSGTSLRSASVSALRRLRT